MTEYIEKNKAIKELYEVYDYEFPTASGGFDEYARMIVPNTIKNMPAADVAPVRHGRWIFGKELPCSWGQIPKNKYHLYCSECLEQAFNRSEDNDPDFDVDTPYCPNCGAKMDGEPCTPSK